MTDVTTAEREQALAEVVEERVLSKREQDHLRQEAEQAEAIRLAAVQHNKDLAIAAVEARGVLLLEFQERLTDVLAIAEKLVDARQAYVQARNAVQKAGGDFTVEYPAFLGVERTERALLRRALDVFHSLGGHV